MIRRGVVAGMLGLVLGIGLAVALPGEALAVSQYKVTASARSTRVSVGAPLTITGRFAVRKKSKRVLSLSYRLPGSKSWRSWNTLTAARSGRFTASAIVQRTAFWRVCKPKDSKGKSGCSREILITAVVPPVPTPPVVTPPPADPRTTNTSGAKTVPEESGDYTWTNDQTRWSQRHKDETDGFFLGAVASAAAPLRIDSVTPSTGSLSGGETVTVTGAGLDTVTGAKMVKSAYTSTFFGTAFPEDSIAVRFKRVSPTTLQFRAPAWGWAESTLVVVNAASQASISYRYEVTAVASTPFEVAVVDAINAVRATGVTCGHGTVMPATTPVVSDDTIADVARNFSNDRMLRSSVYDAALASGALTGPHSRYGGLNIGLAQYVDAHGRSLNAGYGIKSETLTSATLRGSAADMAASAVRVWVGEWGWPTDGHCTAIMSPTITKVGVGLSISDGGTVVVVAETK